ncbi:hypothetical protein MMC31_000782 [Peltigera leucophlebia]|nr:hypothetical protein [Peltigera leucophlebia]
MTLATSTSAAAQQRDLGPASPLSQQVVRSFGATAVFNYKSPTCASNIRHYTHNALSYALDCVTDFESADLATQLLDAPEADKRAWKPAPQNGGREVPLKWSLSLVMRYLGRKGFWAGSIRGLQRRIGERPMLVDKGNAKVVGRGED